MWITCQTDGEFQTSASHPKHQVLAAALKVGGVHIFNEDFEIISTIETKKDAIVKQLKWNPAKKILVAAMSNGSIGICGTDSDKTFREGNAHSVPLTSIDWSPNGARLVTGDVEGNVVVWKVDGRGKLSILSKYRLQGAVEIFSFKTNMAKPRDDKSRSSDSLPFFVSDSTGTIFFADDNGHCGECIKISSPIMMLKFHEGRDLLLVLTDDFLLSHYRLNAEGKLVLDTAWLQIKLGGSAVPAGQKPTISAIFVEPDLLIYNTNNGIPRIWNSEKEETTVLDIQGFSGAMANGLYSNISFSKRNNIISVSTDLGNILLWRKTVAGVWEPLQNIEIAGNVLKMTWGGNESQLAIHKSNGCQLVSQQIVHTASYGTEIFVSQIDSQKVQLEKFNGKLEIIETEEKVKGIAVCKDIMAIWCNSLSAKQSATMKCTSSMFVVELGYAFVVSESRSSVSVLHISSGTTSDITLVPSEGDICAISMSNHRLFILTLEKNIKVFEIQKRESKLIFDKSIDFFVDSIDNLNMKANCDGSYLAIVSSSDPTVLITFDVEDDQIQTYDCAAKINTFSWDGKDKRVVFAQTFGEQESNDVSQILSFFYVDSQLIFKDAMPIPTDSEFLVSVGLPRLFFYKKMEFKPERTERFSFYQIKEYSGIDSTDAYLIKVVTDFSIKLALGDVDEAAKVIELIKNETVWENTAKVCVKMRRTKLAGLCLGKLKNAISLRTIGVTGKGSDDNEIAAQYALHMGQFDVAKEIWSETSNIPSLISFFQSAGEWDRAIEAASTKARSYIPVTYFKYGKYLEDIDKAGAINAYEKSHASKTQVLRLMLNEPDEIRSYVKATTDEETKKWWAYNAESHGDAETAINFFQEANDIASTVRVYCRLGELKKAIDLFSLHPQSKICAYYIAREYEKVKDWSNAISYYSKSSCYSSAIRIAKENGLDKDLLQLGLMSNEVHMADLGRYFEGKGVYDRAITLYAKAKKVQKALELCYKSNDIQFLESIVSQLDPEKDELALQSASRFLAFNGSHETALKILLSSQKYLEVLDVCEKQNIPITENLHASIDTAASANEDVSRSIQLRVGDLCLRQGSYQLACKSFAMAGDRLKAIGALLKSGDRDKIITFANVSRNNQIYIVAANYLQSLNWSNDVGLMRTIIQYYSKAKAYSSLAGFYEACAQFEIDEFQNYEKALDALTEAEKCLQKDVSSVELSAMSRKRGSVELFLRAHERGRVNDIDSCESICAELLSNEKIDEVVRIGDILGLLIETCFKADQIEKARELFKRLKMRLTANLSVQYYVDPAICEKLETPQ